LAVVAAAEARLSFQQLPRLRDGHRIAGP
jgi:hypothetical protein